MLLQVAVQWKNSIWGDVAGRCGHLYFGGSEEEQLLSEEPIRDGNKRITLPL